MVLRGTDGSAEQIRIRVEDLMDTRLASLELLAERWVERRPPDFSQRRFLQFAHALYAAYPGFTGINWLDPEGLIQWVFPEKTNAVVRDKSVYDYPDRRYRNTFEKASSSRSFAVTPCMKVDQGGIGFDAFWPLVYENKIQGYLNGVFQVERVMNTCLAKEFLEEFDVRMYEQGRLIYRNETSGQRNLQASRVRAVRKIHFGGKTWQLDLEPKPNVYLPTRFANLPFLVFGLVLSTALSLVLYFLLRRMAMYRGARDEALHEVSQRKRAEEALRDNEKKLEALLAELAAKNTELEAFVYTVSHDLKTPIVTIEGFIGALREDFGGELPEEGDKYLTHMSNAARKMDSLISDLLELSRLGRLTEKKTEFPFASLVKEVVEALQPQIKASGIMVHIQEDLPVVYGERKRLGQVVDNLMSNAVRYIGNDNPAPRIDVGVEEQDGRQVFYFRDNGIGIDKRYHDKIFVIFQRLPSAKRIGHGTGVGLTIVKRIIERHGGEIWLRSEAGKGTTFFFTLKNDGFRKQLILLTP
jgi:signal transduction histidine kinase